MQFQLIPALSAFIFLYYCLLFSRGFITLSLVLQLILILIWTLHSAGTLACQLGNELVHSWAFTIVVYIKPTMPFHHWFLNPVYTEIIIGLYKTILQLFM